MKRKYTHVVVDSSLNNFKVGTKVYILDEKPILNAYIITDGKKVKFCHPEQLKEI